MVFKNFLNLFNSLSARNFEKINFWDPLILKVLNINILRKAIANSMDIIPLKSSSNVVLK